jgi:hypothetical protein
MATMVGFPSRGQAMNLGEALRRLFRCDDCVEADARHDALVRALRRQTRHAQRQEAAFRLATRQCRMPSYTELYGRNGEAKS